MAQALRCGRRVTWVSLVSGRTGVAIATSDLDFRQPDVGQAEDEDHHEHDHRSCAAQTQLEEGERPLIDEHRDQLSGLPRAASGQEVHQPEHARGGDCRQQQDKKTGPRIRGSVMKRKTFHAPAPSMRAASIRSSETPSMAAWNMIMAKAMPRQVL